MHLYLIIKLESTSPKQENLIKLVSIFDYKAAVAVNSQHAGLDSQFRLTHIVRIFIPSPLLTN